MSLMEKRMPLCLRKILRNAQLRTIFNNLPFWVWLKDVNGRFLLVNEMFMTREIDDNDLEFTIGKTDFDFTTPELANKYLADEKNVMETRVPLSIEEPVLIRWEYKLYETYKAPFIDEDNQLLGTFGFARDITEKNRQRLH